MADPPQSADSGATRPAIRALQARRADDVVSVVSAMVSGCKADLRLCQELAAAAVRAAAEQASTSPERSASRVRELLELVRRLERLPRARSAPPGAGRGQPRPAP